MEDTNFSVSVHGIGRLDVNIPEELKKSVYYEIVDLVLNKIPREDIVNPDLKSYEPELCKPEKPVSSEVDVEILNHLIEPTKENDVNLAEESSGTSIGELLGYRKPEEKTFYKKDYEYYSDKIDADKLVAIKCTDCNKVTVRKINLAKDGAKTHCHWCKNEIELDELTRATFECNCCSTAGYLYVPRGVTEIPCKKCGAPVDLNINKN